MNASRPGPLSSRPIAVRLAQALIWVQFTAIVGLYSIGVYFLLAATTAAASRETTAEVLLAGGLERWILVLIATAVTVSLPVIATRLGRRDKRAIEAAWYALAFVPFCMYAWVVVRAYMATFPEGPEFFLSAGAMFVVCASLPAAIFLCLAMPSARAWFRAEERAEAPAATPERSRESELVGSGV